ncbi:ABC transporter permease subunit [Dactylosporangium sp. NPDC051541]|uniref:ABC transporter permease subunit n=1 Tax=Dactylosporangium sp. NPDC051541 TaxID=3363977 RepID=UPI0037B7F7D5
MKIAVLGLALALAVYAAFPLAEARAWGWLAVLVVVTALIFAIYLSKRAIPLKYLVPGVLFLLAFQVVPVLYTVATAFTNYGDGHRGSKQDAVTAIQSASVQQVPGSVEYALSVALDDGGLKFLLVSGDGKAFVGDLSGLRPLDKADIAGGRITKADGYQLLSLGEATQRNDEILAFTVPTSGGAIRASGLTRAYTGQATRFYDAGCDCITDRATGRTWTADEDTGAFVADDGEHLAQGWKVNVGLSNFARVVTDSRIAGPFLKTLVWNLAFAVGSVLVTFALGLACALALNAKMRGRSWYRVLLVLPYAMPSFAMLLVWRDLFNQDFGLINRITGLHVDWFGSPWTARAAVILVQLWLGYPYMFLVATGALQAIPREMQEAAQIDGATAVQRFRRVTLPLLLVALTPLLISSFAFNFNNFNAIYLTTDGAPFPAGNSSIGATDLLITYTYRLAFGGSGAQLGFAAAISVYIFAIVALISVVGFRRSRKQEEVYT